MSATTVTGNHSGSLVVAAGSTVLVKNATISGAVSVKPGGSLDVEQSTIVGAITDSGGGALRVCGSTVRGSVDAERQFVPVLVEHATNPIDHRPHARGTAQIVVHDHPVFGSELGHRLGDPLEQRVRVARVTR